MLEHPFVRLLLTPAHILKNTLPRFGQLINLAALLATAVLPAVLWAQGGGQPQLDLPRMTLGAGLHQINAQVAELPQTRQIGLMHRKQMPQHEGMLFVFEQSQRQCFWMKNTLLPLTIAFLDDDGTIVNLADMQPLALDSHCSARPVRLVLEMNQGWFAHKGLAAGSRLTGPVFAPRPTR